jgi:hypothetical protein
VRPGVSWTTGSSAVATVDASGLVRGVGVGTTTVTATAEGKSGAAAVSVTAPPPAPVASVTVTLAASILYVGPATQASAVLRDAAGNALSGRALTWSSTNPSVATVGPSTGLVTAVAAGTAGITATSEGRSGAGTVTARPGAVTGIDVIQDFLEQCPTSDPAWSRITRDFALLVDGQPSSTSFACSAPVAAIPVAQVTDELIVGQALRTVYYMSQGTQGLLPWTSMNLYDWMASAVDGINIKTAPGQLYCCDATYDLGNLGSYGVAYSLHSSWATGFLNIGIGCFPAATAAEYGNMDAGAANGLRSRFVTNAPAVVTAVQPYGGPCVGRP